jgi:hypothetical protein
MGQNPHRQAEYAAVLSRELLVQIAVDYARLPGIRAERRLSAYRPRRGPAPPGFAGATFSLLTDGWLTGMAKRLLSGSGLTVVARMLENGLAKGEAR